MTDINRVFSESDSSPCGSAPKSMSQIPDKAPSMQSVVSQVVKESEDLISALEAVGAMYGIPAENILVDDSLRSIKVVNDTIIAPQTSVRNVDANVRAIMCSIGGVLDYISQRVDEKLTSYQNTAIADAKRVATQRDANPAKGNVVGRYFDDNNDEVIVYDTGLCDSSNTIEAHKKIDELRADGKIPEYKETPMSTPTYFSDEDDITVGIDLSDDVNDMTTEPVDIASDIQESYIHLDMISQFNNTTHLGYDLLQSHGFDYVKPIDGMYQESSTGKGDSKIKPEDIKYMKFDNTNIIKAIKFMNDARAEQASVGRGKWSVRQLINNQNWQKAIDCLNKQFDCRLNIRFINSDDGTNKNLYTTMWNDIKTNIKISKSKGFQLGGLPIDIFVIDKSIDDESPKDDSSMFGQFVISGLLHEIFHNIYIAILSINGEFNASISAAMMLASSADSAKARRVILTKYVNSLDDYCGKKLNIITRRKLVKQLLLTSTLQHDQSMLTSIKNKIEDGGMDEKEIDKLIKIYEKIVKKQERSERRRTSPMTKVFAAIGVGISIVLTCTVIGAFIGIPLIRSVAQYLGPSDLEKFRSEKHTEEYWCDLFAGMYKLPFVFLIGVPGNRKFTANSVDPEKLKKLAKLEKSLYEFYMAPYPTIEERTYAAVKIAKNLLETDDLEPAFKDYCQWIVDNHKSILDTDIDTDYNDNTFDPKSAEDLDEHMRNLINAGNITLTEYEITAIMDDIIND